MARDRAERELARLVRKGKSSERLKEGPDRKKWECVRICEEIRKAVRIFLEHAPKERLGPKWEPALRQDPSCRYTPPPGVE